MTPRMPCCPHPHLQQFALIEEELHYEDWRCQECGATVYGPCHHQSLCRADFCGLAPLGQTTGLLALPKVPAA